MGDWTVHRWVEQPVWSHQSERHWTTRHSEPNSMLSVYWYLLRYNCNAMESQCTRNQRQYWVCVGPSWGITVMKCNRGALETKDNTECVLVPPLYNWKAMESQCTRCQRQCWVCVGPSSGITVMKCNRSALEVKDNIECVLVTPEV